MVLMLGLAKVVNSSFSVCTDILNFSKYYAWSLVYIAILTLMAIGLNSILIDTSGIAGAAGATLLAYAAYFALLIRHLSALKTGSVIVFSWGQAKMVAIMIAMVAAYLGWSEIVEPALGMDIILSAAIRTLVLGGLLTAAVLGWKVSPTVNGMVREKLLKVKS